MAFNAVGFLLLPLVMIMPLSLISKTTTTTNNNNNETIDLSMYNVC